MNVDRELWQPLGGIWYRPLDQVSIHPRRLDEDIVAELIQSISTGRTVSLRSGVIVHWEEIPPAEASQLPPPLAIVGRPS